jgi:DNA-binding NtrC family response regulator
MPTLHNRPSTILAVEGEGVIRMELADLLTEAGYCVIAQSSAVHALTTLGVRPDVRLLFTGVDLPGQMDGCALARIVDMRWPGVAILAASCTKRPALGELPTKARFISKPCSASELLTMVGTLLPDPCEFIAVQKREGYELVAGIRG